MPLRALMLRAPLSILFIFLMTACVPAQARPTAPPITALPVPSAQPISTRLPQSGEIISEANAAEVQVLGQIGKGQLQEIALSPDGAVLAVGSSLGVTLYDAVDLKVLDSLPTGEVQHLSYSQSGATLFTAFRMRASAWQLPAGSPLGSYDASETIIQIAARGDVLALALGPRNIHLAEGVVEIIDGAELALLESLPDDDGWLTELALSQDGLSVAAAAAERIRVWAIGSGAPATVLRGHTDMVRALAFLPGGERIVSGSDDGTVRIWQVSDGRLLQTLETPGSVTCLAVTPGGDMIAAGTETGELQIWDADGRLIRSLGGRQAALRQLIFTPDGSGLLTTGDDDTISRWRTADWVQVERTAGYLAGAYDAAFSPDGTSLVTGTIYHSLMDLWRVADGALLRHVQAHQKMGVTTVTYSPDGTLIASGGEDNTVRLWTATGELLRTLVGHQEYVTGVAFSPDGTTLASGSYDKTIRLWRTADGVEVRTLPGHTSWVNSLAFSPDGDLLASSSYDRTVRVWRVADGAPVQTLEDFSSDATAVAFSPDGNLLATGISAGGTVFLYDQTGALLRTLEGGASEQATELAFSPDGALLAASYYEGDPVRLWRVSDGALLAALSGPRDSFSVAFSPDGRTIAAASALGVVTLWGVP